MEKIKKKFGVNVIKFWAKIRGKKQEKNGVKFGGNEEKTRKILRKCGIKCGKNQGKNGGK